MFDVSLHTIQFLVYSSLAARKNFCFTPLIGISQCWNDLLLIFLLLLIFNIIICDCMNELSGEALAVFIPSKRT